MTGRASAVSIDDCPRDGLTRSFRTTGTRDAALLSVMRQRETSVLAAATRCRRKGDAHGAPFSARRRGAGSGQPTSPGRAPVQFVGYHRREIMNEDTLKGQWTQLKGLVREQWGKLTNDDLDQIHGRSEQLVGKLQERYGIARDEAERQLN